MTRRAGVTVAQVERAYAKAKVLLPNIGPLERGATNCWFVGAMFVGQTCREAERYLTGVVDGLRASAFTMSDSFGYFR